MPDRGHAYCTEINSIGVRCSHLATHGEKCGWHNPRRKRCLAFKDDKSQCIRVPMVGANLCSSHAGYRGKLAEEAAFIDDSPVEVFTPRDLDETDFLVEVKDAKAFAKAVLESKDFREYIIYGLRNRDISPTVIIRLMDYAEGWGKPVEQVEVKDTTTPVEQLTAEQLDERAARLAEMARLLRRSEQFSEPLGSDSVH